MGQGTSAPSDRVKTCRKCGRDKPLSLFPEYRPGRRRGTCQSCINRQRSARRVADPNSADRVRGRARDAATNRVRLRAYERSPKGRAARKRKPSRQPEAVNAANRARRAADPDRARERGRRYARLRRLGYDRELAAWVEIVACDPCAYCGGVATGADHIEPLSAGGKSAPDNFTAACFDCNREKRATALLIYLAERP